LFNFDLILFFFKNYIASPQLLGGHKFTLRVYCLITSCDPLRVYVFEEVKNCDFIYIFVKCVLLFCNCVYTKKGLARICSRLYPGDAAHDDTLAHIDSVDLNEHNLTEFENNVCIYYYYYG
jgi:hypothetical protein